MGRSVHDNEGASIPSGLEEGRPDPITAIRARTVAVPLARPFEHGAMFIDERRYAVIEVETAAGHIGQAYGMTRGVPVAEIVSNLAPSLTGMDSDLIDAVVSAAYRGGFAGGRVGGFMRALSLLDIALWDIKGKRLASPVWRLLGGFSPQTQCILVAGYPTGEGPEEIGETVAELSRAGNRLLKVARDPDTERFNRMLATATSGLACGAHLIVDAAWAWSRPQEAVDELVRWHQDTPIAWVEDPLPPEDIESYRRLVTASPVTIGVGDELTDRHAAHGLLWHAGVPVLRVDATTIGGISAAWRLTHVAQAAGALVSYHVYAETHVHLAAAASGTLTETFGLSHPVDPSPNLFHGGPTFAPGGCTATDRPGLGIELDESYISEYAC